jgi:DNA-binding MarR family transcriptional regulator
MKFTTTYTRMTKALADEARASGVARHTIRVLVAIGDAGGSSTSTQVQRDLGERGGHTRRALLTLYDRGLAVKSQLPPTAREGLGRPALQVTLTDTGAAAVERVRAAAKAGGK